VNRVVSTRNHSLYGRALSAHELVALAARRNTTSNVCGGPVTDHPLSNPHNGPLMTSPQIYNVGWGPVADGARLNNFSRWLASSWYVANLGREYNDSQGRIGPGQFRGAVTAANGRPPAVVHDSDIRSEIEWLILHGAIPATGASNAIFVYLPPGVTAFNADGDRSCRGVVGEKCFCAYHGAYWGSNSQPRFYAVMPDMNQAHGACGGPGDNLGDRTVAASHELAEMITDPSQITWQTPSGNEIGDICNRNDARPNRFLDGATGWWLQCEWSNRQNACTTTL
jgi:hypothetical protein